MKNLTLGQKLKIDLLASGMSISDNAKEQLTRHGQLPLGLNEYPTTTGITLVLPCGNYVQARSLDKCNISLDYDNGGYFLNYQGEKVDVKPLPMPDYMGRKNSEGIAYEDLIVTLGDRMRISPIKGCSFNCKYCSLPNLKYRCVPVLQLIDAIEVALKDNSLKARHLLISGGTPLPKDRAYLDQVYQEVTQYLKSKQVPVEIMLAPRPEEDYLAKLKSWGVEDVIINLELWNKDIAKKINPKKALLTRQTYLNFIQEAVSVFGRGHVRSGLIVGLEPMEDTLAAVEALAEIGCDIELSPFVPAEDIALTNLESPSSEMLVTAYKESKKIAEKEGVLIGCNCVSCQYNILAFAEDVSE